MPCLITAPTRSDIKRLRDKKTDNKISKNKNFTAKTDYLNLKAPSNNVKMQSDITLTTQTYFLLTIQHRWKVFFMTLGNKSTMRRN